MSAEKEVEGIASLNHDKAEINIEDQLEQSRDEILQSVKTENLGETLETRKAWKNYQGDIDFRGRSPAKILGTLGLVFAGWDFLAQSNTAETGAAFGVAASVPYLMQRRAEQAFDEGQEHIDAIDEDLEECYVLPASYDLSGIRDNIISDIENAYQQASRKFRDWEEAENLAKEELEQEHPEESWEDNWEEFMDSEMYSDGMQVLWLYENEDVLGIKDITGWNIQVYEEENGDYNMIHQSYGVSEDIESVEKVKEDGMNVKDNLQEFNEIFDVQKAKIRVRKPI